MITLRSVLLCGVAALAILFTGGCANSGRELQYKDVEIAELKRQVAELEAQLAKRDVQAVNAAANTPDGAGSALTDEKGLTVDETAAGTTITLASDIFFKAGSADLNTPAKSSLNRVVAVIEKDKKYAGRKIRIDGHTDSDPIRHSKWKDNQDLSEARADAVKTYVVTRGLDNSRVRTVGHADSAPLGKDKAKNRRVEIFIAK